MLLLKLLLQLNDMLWLKSSAASLSLTQLAQRFPRKDVTVLGMNWWPGRYYIVNWIIALLDSHTKEEKEVKLSRLIKSPLVCWQHSLKPCHSSRLKENRQWPLSLYLAYVAIERKPPRSLNWQGESMLSLWQVNSDTMGGKSTDKSLHSYCQLSLDPYPCLVTTLDKGELDYHPDLHFLIPRDTIYRGYDEKSCAAWQDSLTAATGQTINSPDLLNGSTAIFLKYTRDAIMKPLFKNFQGPSVLTVGPEGSGLSLLLQPQNSYSCYLGSKPCFQSPQAKCVTLVKVFDVSMFRFSYLYNRDNINIHPVWVFLLLNELLYIMCLE